MTSLDIQSRFEQYRADGYTVFHGVYNETAMTAFRQEVDRLEATHSGIHEQRRSWWFGNMLERAPGLMWPVVNNPTILDFAEQVVGPFVQLDNLTLAAFPPLSEDEATDRVSGWHRDRWAHVPNGHYEQPLALNAIGYLQDLDDDNGSLRIVPNSHLDPITLDDDARQKRHENEILVYMKSGDVILTHNGLMHSGTPNRSGKKRYFLSVYYNISWLKHTDTFDGPNCRQLITWSREHNDHRALRLLGVEDNIGRANSGFLRPEEERWKQWSEEDRQALNQVENAKS